MSSSDLKGLSIRHPKKSEVQALPVFEIFACSASPRQDLRSTLKAALTAFIHATGDSYRWAKASDETRVRSMRTTG